MFQINSIENVQRCTSVLYCTIEISSFVEKSVVLYKMKKLKFH